MVHPEKKFIGKISHYYPKISVAVVDLEDSLKVGDKIIIERTSGTFEQTVDSIQIEHENIPEARKGQSIGLKISEKTREGAKVYKVIE
jgi:putative protease